jgi:hypothetical protein
MVTALVRFPLPASVSAEDYRRICREAAPAFRDPPGLLSKQFLLAEDGRSGGGAYLWRARADAERFYGPAFRAMIRGHFGCDPEVTYFETTALVDNRC